MMPPAIRRVPPQTEADVEEWATPDEGRFIATFLLESDGNVTEFKVYLPWREGDPTLSELETEARQAVKEQLSEIIAKI